MGTYVSREFSLTTEFTRAYARTMYGETPMGENEGKSKNLPNLRRWDF